MLKNNLCNFSVSCSPKTNVVWSCYSLMIHSLRQLCQECELWQNCNLRS